ncbi:MAG: hypothetical protein ACO2ZB_03635 [Gammaproteobacteria bacterium]|jgi:hypothetical protein
MSGKLMVIAFFLTTLSVVVLMIIIANYPQPEQAAQTEELQIIQE